MQRLLTFFALASLFVVGEECSTQSNSLATANQLASQKTGTDWPSSVLVQPVKVVHTGDLAPGDENEEKVEATPTAF